MTKSALTLCGALLVALFCLCVAGMCWVGRGGLVIRVPLTDAQARIDARLPIESRARHHAYKITSAKIAFDGTGRVQLDCDFGLELAGRAASGQLRGDARPVYRDHAIYLDELDVTHIEVHALDLAPEDRRDRPLVDAAISVLVRGLLAGTPVYSLDDKTFQHRLARATLREIRVEPGVIVAVFDPTTGWRGGLLRLGL